MNNLKILGATNLVHVVIIMVVCGHSMRSKSDMLICTDNYGRVIPVVEE